MVKYIQHPEHEITSARQQSIYANPSRWIYESIFSSQLSRTYLSSTSKHKNDSLITKQNLHVPGKQQQGLYLKLLGSITCHLFGN